MNQIAPIETRSLPALVDRAASALTNARTAAEVLEARDLAGFAYDTAKRTARLAKAKDAHDELVAAALRAQADALVIEAQAKARLADEYDAAQERGEVAANGQRGKAVPDGNGFSPPTAADLGLNRKDIHEARIIRDAERADPGVVRRTLDEALSLGDEPTKARLREAVIHVARNGLGEGGPSRRNPLYVKPSPLAEAYNRISGTIRDLAEASDEFSALAILNQSETPFLRADLIRSAEKARAFLVEMIEGSDDA
ncbi:hypothetical protein [Alsobacter sp. R-9]